jgi:acyl-CoA thioesterase II
VADPLQSFNELLALIPLDERDTFEAVTHGEDAGVSRIFGGHVAAQCLLAAARSAPEGRPAHAAHCSFVRSGRPGVPLRIEVERVRDGRSFTTRQVRASQEGQTIFVLTASFHAPEQDGDWQEAAMPDVPGPEEGDPTSIFATLPTLGVFDVRVVGRATSQLPPAHPCWIRVRDRLPDDPAVHAAAIASISDVASVRGTMPPGFRVDGELTGASLDHAMWFHRQARADDWLLLTMAPLSHHASRALGLGRVHAPDGRLVATYVQEALLRRS